MKEAAIFINQIGYLPDNLKFAYVTAECKGNQNEFSVCESSSNKEIFKGQLTATTEDTTVGEPIFIADFSSVKATGSYYVCVGNNKSFSFKIENKVYNNLYKSILQYFNDSRCGQGICHTGIAEIYGTDKTKNVQGGWHDAGDYGRYVVAGTKAVMDLLLAYDNSMDSFSDFNILDEVRFELEWLLQMQREDGAVYHKISCYHFCNFIAPAEEKDTLVLAPVSTAATADFAGCLAYASNYYKETDKKFSETLVKAALKAQNYLFSHEDELYINPPEITTGGYGDKDVSDERYFALCSLFAITGDENYLNHAMKIREAKKNEQPDEKNPWRGKWREGFGWPFVTGYGTEILLKNEDKIQNKEILLSIKEDLHKQADGIVEFAKKSSVKFASKFIFWGSNGAVCDVAHCLMMAYDVFKNEEYKQFAKAQVDYVLGCNPLNYCYVTCAGSKNPVNPHHRPSGARGKVFAGMLVGGPCATLVDEYAKQHLQNTPALKCYADVVPSYSTNEVAIYWNSALVTALSYFI